MLKEVYPTVNWRRVDFYEGLPWYTPFIAPYVNAQALPQFYSFSRYRIYLTKFDESRAQCLSDIVHEGFHVMQAMEFAKGYGLGILRGFTVYYSALYIKYGYRNNPFEIPAYDQEFRFLDFCEKHHQHGIQPAVDPAIFKNISQETPLVFRHFEFSYRERFVLLVLGFIFCLLLLPLKPLLDALIFLVRLVFFKRRRLAGEVRRL
jgi:hypothetical protein